MDHNDDDLSFFAPVTPEDLAISLPSLTQRQDIFVKVFDGDLIRSARIAGFQGTPDQLRNAALRCLANPKVKEAIKNREKYDSLISKAIADKNERLLFYSSLMRNTDPYGKLDELGKDASEKEIPLAQRIKAAELLSKASGDFIETVNINHNVSVSDLILKSYEDDTPIEAIEAQYKLMKEKQALPTTEEGESILGDLI